ncbi:ECF RNA polymerase sigma-E factor [Kordia sp. SMS9]|uniref:RNA polymerase sigma factor n=1 Tax=Kordia sp. SMS9 TaxID=2282170 RepID=UPI000E0DE2D2|nr:sigma-70 family RNA polymerase sigma factor [Kordia sp. SMS9]AXG72407.1 ECF RNA polymerase sigma-E factor [Kordia sp. SMS9]
MEEKELIDLLKKGDTKAFSLLVDNYQNLIFNVVRRILPKQMDAEDVCQEVFVKIYKGVGSFKQESKLSTWIAKIAYFTALNYLKKNKKNDTHDDLENSFSVEADMDGPDEVLIKKNTTEYVHKLIAQLPEKYCVLLTLYHLEEFSIEEIHQTTGIAKGTIKSHLFRARKLLKDKIKAYLIDDYGGK